jgi:hypothetical protein
MAKAKIVIRKKRLETRQGKRQACPLGGGKRTTAKKAEAKVSA